MNSLLHGRILMICNSATTIAPKIVSTTAAQKIAEKMGIAKAIRRRQPGQATAVLEIGCPQSGQGISLVNASSLRPQRGQVTSLADTGAEQPEQRATSFSLDGASIFSLSRVVIQISCIQTIVGCWVRRYEKKLSLGNIRWRKLLPLAPAAMSGRCRRYRTDVDDRQ